MPSRQIYAWMQVMISANMEQMQRTQCRVVCLWCQQSYGCCSRVQRGRKCSRGFGPSIHSFYFNLSTVMSNTKELPKHVKDRILNLHKAGMRPSAWSLMRRTTTTAANIHKWFNNRANNHQKIQQGKKYLFPPKVARQWQISCNRIWKVENL